MTAGWKLDAAQRAELLQRFPPHWPDVIADHVTEAENATSPPSATAGRIVGWVDDDDGLEAAVVAIGGQTARADGSVYHITWSLDRSRGRRAIESNALAQRGWRHIAKPELIWLVPARWSDATPEKGVRADAAASSFSSV